MSPLLEWWHESSYVLRMHHWKRHRKNLESTTIWPPILVHPWFRPGYLLTGFTNDHIFSISFILQLKFLQMWDAAFGHWKLLWLFCWMYNLVYFLWRNRANRTQAASLLSFLDHTYLDTHTHPTGLVWTSESARRRSRYLHSKQQTEEKIHALGGTRIRDSRKIVRTHGHQDRRIYDYYN